MKTKIVFFVICNLVICNLQFSQNITNTLGSSGVFTLKDNATTYLSLSQSTGNLSLNRSLVLPNTTTFSTGVVFKGGNSFLHNYQGTSTLGMNTFLGINAGNFTLGGTVSAEGSYNTGVGYQSLSSLTTGYQNSAFGMNSLFTNSTGRNNSAFGMNSLFTNSTGHHNSSFGASSLFSNTTGNFNSAFGYMSLRGNTTGSENSSFGYFSLTSNSTGFWNSAFGNNSMFSNTTGRDNSAFGFYTLNNNTTGNYNSAFGSFTLRNNTIGENNSAFGYTSLNSNTTGSGNCAFGFFSLRFNTTGFNNTAYGYQSLVNNTGNYNTALGYNAGSTITTGANLTCLGIDAAPSSPTAIDQVTLGNGFVNALRCNVQTITSLSDARDKKNISELSIGLDFITKLHPRQFNWDKREWYDDNHSDGSKMNEAPTAGFIAQELDEVQQNSGADWLNLVLKDNPEKWEATYGNLLPVMVKAIQELKAENDELKEKLSKFEQIQNVMAGEIEKMKSNNSGIKEAKLTEK